MPGRTITIWIDVYLDSKNKYHRALPDFLIPYKHYSVQTIESALDDDMDLDQYDNPSDSSRSRWESMLYAVMLILMLKILISGIFRKLLQAEGLQTDDPEALLELFQKTYRRDVHKQPDYLSARGWLAQIMKISSLTFR